MYTLPKAQLTVSRRRKTTKEPTRGQLLGPIESKLNDALGTDAIKVQKHLTKKLGPPKFEQHNNFVTTATFDKSISFVELSNPYFATYDGTSYPTPTVRVTQSARVVLTFSAGRLEQFQVSYMTRQS